MFRGWNTLLFLFITFFEAVRPQQAVNSNSWFTEPGRPGQPHDFTENKRYDEGSLVTLKWTTGQPSVELYLKQYDPDYTRIVELQGHSDGSTFHQSLVPTLSTHANEKKEWVQHDVTYNWTVSLIGFNIDAHGPVFSFVAENNVNRRKFESHYFNISRAAEAPATPNPYSSASSSSTADLTAAVPTITPEPSPTPPSSPPAPETSGMTTSVKIAISVGAFFGAVGFAMGALGLYLMRRIRKRTPPELEISAPMQNDLGYGSPQVGQYVYHSHHGCSCGGQKMAELDTGGAPQELPGERFKTARELPGESLEAPREFPEEDLKGAARGASGGF